MRGVGVWEWSADPTLTCRVLARALGAPGGVAGSCVDWVAERTPFSGPGLAGCMCTSESVGCERSALERLGEVVAFTFGELAITSASGISVVAAASGVSSGSARRARAAPRRGIAMSKRVEMNAGQSISGNVRYYPSDCNTKRGVFWEFFGIGAGKC